MMTVTNYFLDLVFLFISLQTAILLTLYLPFGSTNPAAPTIMYTVYLLLALIWGALFGTQRVLNEKFHKRGEVLRIAASALFFSLVQYLIIGGDNASFSRLFLAFFLAANLLGLLASARFYLLLQTHSTWLLDRARKIWAAYNALNDALYRYYGEVIAAALVGIIWANHILKMGLTLTSDAVTYLRIALAFAADGELSYSTNPPFYPLLISLTKFLTPFPADGAAILSAACLVIFFLIFSLLLRRFSSNSIANILLIFLLATFSDFTILFLNAWTEQLYAVFLVANFYLLVKHQSDPRWGYLAGAGLVVLMAMVTRYISISMGVMLILYALFLSEPQKRFTSRVRKYTWAISLSFIPFLSLLYLEPNIRQAVLGYLGEKVGRRALGSYFLGDYSLTDVSIRFLKVFWETAGQPYVLLSLALLLFIFFFRHKTLDQKRQGLLRLNLVFLLGYLALSIGIFSVTVHAPLPRYWMPLYFFFLLGTAQTIDIFSKNNTSMFVKSLATRAFLLVLLLALPLYTFVLQSMGAENILIDRVRDAGEKPIHPYQEGFNVSPTAEKFRGFFEEISKENDQNTIVVIEGDLNRNTMIFENDFGVAESFLFKRGLISSPGFSNFNFFGIEERSQHLSYHYAEQYKELHLIIPTRNTISDLILQLESSAQKEADAQGVFLIINEQWFTLFAEEQLGDQLNSLQARGTIEPYLAFELHPTPLLND